MLNLQFLVWVGTGLTVLGLIGIGWCIVAARAARQDIQNDEAMHARMRRIVSVNMGALMASLLGLILVAVGVFFGR